MKSERRHELETNSLALWLRFRGPEVAQKHGAKILLGIVVALLAVVLIRNRIEAPKRAAASAASYLASAREQIDQLRDGKRLPGESGVIVTQIRNAVEQSDDPNIQADAHLATGDYYWTLANWPELPRAATQPQLRPAEPRQDLLKKAEDAYTRVLGVTDAAGYVSAAAHFGLGAIEETRAFEMDRANLGKTPVPENPHWPAARKHYDQIVAGPKTPQLLKEEAQGRLTNLTRLQEPLWIVAATQPAMTMPSTSPAATIPFNLPVNVPSVMLPSTVPATLPTTRPAP